MKAKIVICVLLLWASIGFAQSDNSVVDRCATQSTKPVAERLQDVSVTLKSEGGQGSGVIVKRGEYNFVLTAGHVVADLRRTREVVDSRSGTGRTIVEFGNANVVQKIYQEGRIVGSLEMEARIVCYSDAEHGEDLAVLQILKKNFIQASTVFYLDDTIPSIGTELYHVGSLQGEFGSNSLTTGIISQIGRVYKEKLYDQTSCTAFPGSSGGGVFVKSTGEYMGMLVRGSGETFNLVVPIRRIRAWTDHMGLSFIIDPKVTIPSEEELKRIPIEDTGREFMPKSTAAASAPASRPAK